MTLNNRQRFRILASLTLLVLSCSSLIPIQSTATIAPQATPLPSSTAAVLTEEDIKQGIQTALDIFSEAYAKNDLELLSSVLDLENRPFSRFVKTRFKTDQESFNGNGIEDTYVVD